MSQDREPFLTNMARLFTPKQLLLAGIFLLYFSWILSWKLAIILMGALMFHELGHAWAMRRYGLRVSGFYFMPPFGLAVVTRDPWPTRQAEAVIALMGPFWGLLMALATYGLYLATGNPVLAGLTAWFALLNAFNLLPTNPLDGGRVVKSLAFSISPKLGFVILIAGLALTAWLALNFLGLILGALIVFMGVLEFRQELRQYRRRRDRELILKVLAEELRCQPTPEAVLNGLQQEVDRTWDEQDREERLAVLSRLQPGQKEGDLEPLIAWMMTPLSLKALLARRPYAPLLWGDWSFATSAVDMIPLPLADGQVESSPLGQFLLEEEAPGMKAGGGALTLIAYLGLAAILLALFAVASRTMDLMQVINALR